MARERPDLKPLVGQKLTVIAWFWARTVKSPNPVFSHMDVPLRTSFELCSKPRAEAWLHPVIGKLRQERPTIEGVAQIFKNWKIVFAKG